VPGAIGSKQNDAGQDRAEGEALKRPALASRHRDQAVGMEWDQPRLNYTMYPAGPDPIGDFRAVGMRVRKFADMHREFADAAARREAKAPTASWNASACGRSPPTHVRS
jgi:hypothetical protein